MIPKPHDHQTQLQSDPAASETEPLPPLPDGGLARAMPDWLRADPPPPSSPPAAPVAATDPSGFITEDDLPDWLRQLSPAAPAPLPRAEAPPSQPPLAAMPAPRATIPTIEPSPATASPPRQLEPAPVARSTPAPSPEPSNRRAIVAVAGVLLLALGVVAYLYATRGGF